MKILKNVVEELIAQARQDLPNESCGYLLGTNGVITLNYAMTNGDNRPEHFSFIPQEQFDAVRYARKNSLTVLANWHSHPSSPSRPSQEDIKLAYDSSIAYLILSLASESPVLNAFKINNGNVEKIELEII